MSLGLIWAQSTSGVIGRDNGIPWRLPEDQARFKELTMGHTVVMGRLTWESLPAKVRPLPGRRNVVVTRQAEYVADGATVVGGLDEALDRRRDLGDRGRADLRAGPADGDPVRGHRGRVDLPREDDDAVAPVLDEAWVGTDGELADQRVRVAVPLHHLRAGVNAATEVKRARDRRRRAACYVRVRP